jgi:hypothetical protein
MPHYRKTTEFPDYMLDWAYKEYKGKQRKRKKEKEIKYKKKKRPYSPKKKKVRGAKKKELLRKEKKEFPLGRRMESRRDVPLYRQVVYPKDVMKLMHLSPRGARQYLARIRKALNKKPGEVLTLKEFCDNSPFERNDVIPYLLD